VRHWLRPGLLGLHAFAVVAVGFCVGMGLWQLGVYDSRQEHERSDRRVVPRVALTDVWGPDQPFEGRLENRPVRVEGRFAPSSEQVWVTGREQDGRRGVWLVAPVRVSGTRASLLVVRGWSPRLGDLPPVPDGDVAFDAALQAGEGTGEPFNPDTRTLDSVSIPVLTNVVPGDLFSGYAIGTSRSTMGDLAAVEPPAPGTSWTVGLRNLAYAMQWWVFGAFALFMWWRMATENVAMRRAAAAAEAVSEPPVA
jgi:cytochrome oxidase assembly protein ShyY1